MKTISQCKIGDADGGSASMVLVRMVNKIPLLDSAEAVACGLVQGLSSKKRLWNSFGLDVGLKSDPSNVGKLPIFEVRDSDQVAPFFKSGAHKLLEQDDDDESDLEENSDTDTDDSVDSTASLGVKRKRGKRRHHNNLLPASVRLGNILVITQIHAEPTTLPLPTLSKVGPRLFVSPSRGNTNIQRRANLTTSCFWICFRFYCRVAFPLTTKPLMMLWRMV